MLFLMSYLLKELPLFSEERQNHYDGVTFPESVSSHLKHCTIFYNVFTFKMQRLINIVLWFKILHEISI